MKKVLKYGKTITAVATFLGTSGYLTVLSPDLQQKLLQVFTLLFGG